MTPRGRGKRRDSQGGGFCSYRLILMLSLLVNGFLVAYMLHLVSIMEDPLVVEASTGPNAAYQALRKVTVPEVPSAQETGNLHADQINNDHRGTGREHRRRKEGHVTRGQAHTEAHHTTLHEFVRQTLPGPNPEEPRIPPLPVQVYIGSECQTPVYDLGLCRTQNSPTLAMGGRSGEFRCSSPWLPRTGVLSYRWRMSPPSPLSPLSSLSPPPPPPPNSPPPYPAPPSPPSLFSSV
jgi:hypothetical protein